MTDGISRLSERSLPAADVYTYDYKESSKTISQNPQVYDLHGILPYPNPPQNK